MHDNTLNYLKMKKRLCDRSKRPKYGLTLLVDIIYGVKQGNHIKVYTFCIYSKFVCICKYIQGKQYISFFLKTIDAQKPRDPMSMKDTQDGVRSPRFQLTK